MQIDDALIDRLLSISRLRIAPDRRPELKADMERILGFVEKIQEVDCTGVEPLIHVNEEVNHLRPDKPGEVLSHEDALQNAPSKDSDYFRVPKFIERE